MSLFCVLEFASADSVMHDTHRSSYTVDTVEYKLNANQIFDKVTMF